MFGRANTIGAVCFALIFGVYDYNAWGFASGTLPESWIYDLGSWNALSNIALDQVYYYVNGFGAILWLIAWEITWLFTGQFLYWSVAYLLYLYWIIYRVPYLNETEIIWKAGSNDRFMRIIISIGGFYAIFLTIRTVYWWFFDIWWSDTISTYLLLVLFLILVIAPPIMVADDLNEDIDKEIKEVEKLGIGSISNLIDHHFDENTPVDNAKAATAVMYYLYTQELKDRKKISKDFRNNILKAAAAPLISLLIKYLLIFIPAEILAQIWWML